MDTDTYQQFSEEDEHQTLLGRCLECLYAYTIGSCSYAGYNGDREKDGGMVEMCQKSNRSVHYHKEQESIRLAEAEMKERLHNHFKSHIGKWASKNRRRFPWKVILHIFLLILITTQVNNMSILKCFMPHQSTLATSTYSYVAM